MQIRWLNAEVIAVLSISPHVAVCHMFDFAWRSIALYYWGFWATLCISDVCWATFMPCSCTSLSSDPQWIAKFQTFLKFWFPVAFYRYLVFQVLKRVDANVQFLLFPLLERLDFWVLMKELGWWWCYLLFEVNATLPVLINNWFMSWHCCLKSCWYFVLHSVAVVSPELMCWKSCRVFFAMVLCKCFIWLLVFCDRPDRFHCECCSLLMKSFVSRVLGLSSCMVRRVEKEA
jgi:hypothetical protein